MCKSYVPLPRNILMTKGTDNVARYLDEKRNYPEKGFKATILDEDHEPLPNKKTELTFKIEDKVRVVKNPCRELKLDEDQASRLHVDPHNKNFYNTTTYDLCCFHDNKNKGIKIEVCIAYTGLDLIRNRIRLSDIVCYMLLAHGRKFNIHLLPLHSIEFFGVSNTKSDNLSKKLRQVLINKRPPYSGKVLIMPKIRDKEKISYSRKRAFDILYDNERKHNVGKVKISEYAHPEDRYRFNKMGEPVLTHMIKPEDGPMTKHMFLSSGLGKSVWWLCHDLKISLANAKVSYSYTDLTEHFLRQKEQSVERIKVNFGPSCYTKNFNK